MNTMKKMLQSAGCDLGSVEFYQFTNRRWGDDCEEIEEVVSGVRLVGDEPVLNREFDSGFGKSEGPSALVYTPDRIYFSCVYDGAEWIESVPRYPQDGFVPVHFGGE